jgi:hypothetical protein
LEHGLLCQYVFAAVTLKQTPDEGISWRQAELIRDWKATLLEVARQEMAHLGTVCNMLTAVGAAPHFMRLNFPRAAQHFPPDAPFILQPFGAEAMTRFIRFEEPVHPAGAMFALDIAPKPIEYQHVGELYRSIEAGFVALADEELFIGPQTAQDDSNWSRGLHLWPVRDLASVKQAVEFIVAEGEGTTSGSSTSHYQRFLAASSALEHETAQHPGFRPARPVATNPVSRPHPDASQAGSVVTDPGTLAISELFSVTYETTLLMLTQFYSFGPESSEQRLALRQAAREMMSAVIRPLAEVLTLLPMGPDQPGLTAGPGFELYGDVQVSPHAANAWFVIVERLRREGTQCLALTGDDGPLRRLRLCGENLIRIAMNLQGEASAGFHQPTVLNRRTVARLATAVTRAQPPTRLATARYGLATEEDLP